MTGYEAFTIYHALKLHFNQDSYDYFRYNGKSRITVDNFEKRKDKYYFYKLSRQYTSVDDYRNFLIANFVEDEKIWVGKLLEEESVINYRNHQKVIQSMSYIFENECRKLFEDVSNPNDVIVTQGEYPILLTKTLQKTVSLETLCLLNKILNFLPMWSKRITDDIRWPNYRRKIEKFTVFLPQDVLKYKLILKKILG